jgi:hypothetical protein
MVNAACGAELGGLGTHATAPGWADLTRSICFFHTEMTVELSNAVFKWATENGLARQRLRPVWHEKCTHICAQASDGGFDEQQNE